MKAFKQFDYFRKVQEDLKREQTTTGGIIGFSTIVVILVLVIYETFCVFFGHYKTFPFINNTNPNEKVRINLNITFEDVFCKALSVDYQDVSGTHLEDMHLTLHKIRLDQYGRFIDYDSVQSIKQEENKRFYPGNPFFQVVKSNNNAKGQYSNNVSCYGAELHEGQLCFTCSDVLIAFAQRGWPQPMKEQISQCNEGSKEEFKSVKMIDGEVKTSKAVAQFAPPPDQNNLIETLKKQNIVEQLINQIDERIFDFLDEHDKKFFEEKLMELNELQYNPSDTSERQNHAEIMTRVQQIQTIIGKHYAQLEAIKPKQIQLSVSSQMVNLVEIPTDKKILFQFSVGRPMCSEEIIYKVRLNSTLNSTFSYSETSELFKNEGMQNMKVKECSHVFPIFIQKSSIGDGIIIISIPDFDIQQQYIYESKNWSVNLELIKDSSTYKFVKENSKKSVTIYYNPQQAKQNQFNENQQKKINENEANLQNQKQQNNQEENKQPQQNQQEQQQQQQANEQKVNQTDKVQQSENMNENNQQNQTDSQNRNNTEDIQSQQSTIKNNQQQNQTESNEQNPQQTSDSLIEENQKENNQDSQPKNRRRNLFQQNYGKEDISGEKVFSSEVFVEMQQQMARREKCQIYGHFYVKKVPGNFHISFHNEGLLLLYFNTIMNLRHTIHTLEFTTEDGTLSLGRYTKSSNPLDGSIHNPGHGMDNDYYLKVVNTVFENLMSGHSNIYSFTSLEMSGGRDFRLPSVNFRYEFDPISVLHYRKSRSLSQFIVSLCAIIGGSIAISKYIHILLVK